jgi:hypothetical protein
MRRALATLLALAAVACNQGSDPTFTLPNTTATPPPGADLLVVTNALGPNAALDQPRDVFALSSAGSGDATLLTACRLRGQRCDTEEADLSADGVRVITRRYTDAALPDATSATLVELSESLEGIVVAASQRVSGVDYSSRSELVVYSALGESSLEDLYVMLPTGADVRNLTASATVHERRPRIDPTGSVAVFDRSEGGAKTEVWLYTSRIDQRRLTSGGPGEGTLPGSDTILGSDRDPTYSPDGQAVVFRRLVGVGDGRGNWELLTIRTDGTQLATIVAGPGFRGAPDWGPDGIAFVESDAQGSRIVVAAADGSTRRDALRVAPGFVLSHPRWIP